MDGEIEEVSRPVGAAAYRVVQEALTNVLRHSGARHATVSVAAGGAADLAVEVRLSPGRSEMEGKLISLMTPVNTCS